MLFTKKCYSFIIYFEKVLIGALISKLASCLAFQKAKNDFLSGQWNIWDGVFYENSWRAVPVNNFRKKIHLTFHLRGSEFDSDLNHSDK